MSEKRINRKHPDYKEFKRRFEQLSEEMRKEAEIVKETQGAKGLDGPVAAIHKKYHVMFTALIKEYAHLYTEE